MSAASAPESPAAAPSCYRHPGRGTHPRCCDRCICVDCMRTAAVGHPCAECVRGARRMRRPRTLLIAINALMFIWRTGVLVAESSR
ncbi:hypothetical protein [Mycobacterium sp.]|uniref:hypothetical protein n=1 Tax=Mycobacterium sp. TaxID=1785 RepID=UPI0039C8E168